MAQNRNELVDFYKGFLMFGVIWGHTITALKGGLDVGPVFIHTFLRIYDMPFFMILSGFFLGKSLLHNSCKRVLINRISMILFPVVLWNLVARNINFSSFYFLWAVFVSSSICISGYWLGNYCKNGRYIELCVEILVTLILYTVDIPWNMFYLFPFFILGRYLPNIEFRLSHFMLVFFCFIMLICFWKGEYSPWVLGYDEWKNDIYSIGIYFYRFTLGVLGTYIAANILKVLYTLNWGGKSVLIKSGKQTLAIYILQTFIVERFFAHIIRALVERSCFTYDSIEVNIMGYVVAPIIAYTVLIICSMITDKLENYKYTKYVFGFKFVR